MQYFADKRCVFPSGRIQLQTEFPFYEPGNIVNGKIFIEVGAQVKASHIELKVIGREKAKFIRHWTESDDEGFDEDHSEKMNRERNFLEFKDRVFAIPDGTLYAGSSEVSF